MTIKTKASKRLEKEVEEKDLKDERTQSDELDRLLNDTVATDDIKDAST